MTARSSPSADNAQGSIVIADGPCGLRLWLRPGAGALRLRSGRLSLVARCLGLDNTAEI